MINHYWLSCSMDVTMFTLPTLVTIVLYFTTKSAAIKLVAESTVQATELQFA